MDNEKNQRGGRQPKGIDATASFFKMMSERNRLDLLARIAARPTCVKDLGAQMALESSLISHHLRPMLRAGLVEYEQNGHEHVFGLGPAVLAAEPVAGGVRVTIRDPSGLNETLTMVLPLEDQAASLAEVKPPARTPATKNPRPDA